MVIESRAKFLIDFYLIHSFDEPSSLHLSNYTNFKHPFLVLFARLLSGWTTTTVDFLVPMENKRKVPFLKTQRRTASLGIEPGVNNLLITNPMLYLCAIAIYFDIINFYSMKF